MGGVIFTAQQQLRLGWREHHKLKTSSINRNGVLLRKKQPNLLVDMKRLPNIILEQKVENINKLWLREGLKKNISGIFH